MLPFRDALNNDNPVSDDLNLAALNTWYYALMLIGSNLFGYPLVIYCHKHAFFLLSVSTFFAVGFSLLYHTCQTTHVCFGISLSLLTLADHISAPAFMMMLILFIINSKSSKQIKQETRQRAHFLYKSEQEIRNVYVPVVRTTASSTMSATITAVNAHTMQFERFLNPGSEQIGHFDKKKEEEEVRPRKRKTKTRYDIETSLNEEQIEEIESQKTYHHVGYSHAVSNDENNAWGVYAMYSCLFIVILAALAHHFSLQAFIIGLVYGLALIFFKHVVIDEGVSLGMYERVSLVDLVTGVILLALSLVFYMLDIYVAYAITHSLWHCLSFTGSYLMVVGLSKNCDGWYSPIDFLYKKTLKCCLNAKEEEEEEGEEWIEEELY